MKSNGCVTLLNKYTTKKFIAKPQSYVNELMLTPFRPIDIKCKIIDIKCIFRASRRVSFSNFPRVALDHRGKRDAPQYILEFLWIMLQYSNQALCDL